MSEDHATGGTMRLRLRVPAPLARVRHALTDGAALRAWLAEYAEVDLPSRYEFWGRSTPEGDEPRQHPLRVDERTVRFAWTLDGTETVVEIDLAEEDADATILTLSQTDLPSWTEVLSGTDTGSRGLMHTYWSLALANLVDHLAGRALTGPVDLTSPELRAEVTIAAPPEDVYRSLTDPDEFSRWFGARMELEPHVGGRWAMGGFDNDPQPARIVALEHGRRISLAWSDQVSTFELADSGGATRLTLVESGFDEKRPPYDGWLGWLSGLAELRRYHELPAWRPIWLAVEMPGLPDGILTLG
ncbi:SRPBCC family protein [Micromonospora sp. NPDC049559]|uniref:SRPBCC family protein n=1 Tax=Micromonospora sp. NPDC049559 TaxID=3155923 RepID=UPI0034197A9F